MTLFSSTDAISFLAFTFKLKMAEGGQSWLDEEER